MKKRDKCEILVVLWFIAANVCSDDWCRLGASVVAFGYMLSAFFPKEEA